MEDNSSRLCVVCSIPLLSRQKYTCSKKCDAVTRCGIPRSEEVKRKMSVAQKGIARGPLTEATRQKMSVSLQGKNVGKVRTFEQKLHQHFKQVGRNKGIPKSEETKRKMRETRQRMLAEGWNSKSVSSSELAWGKRIFELFGITLQHSFWLEKRCFDYRYQNYLFEIE